MTTASTISPSPRVSALESRLLLGPGPSPTAPRILEALGHPTLGHLDPQFLDLLDDTNERLRRVFGTRNETTFAVSGTGSAAMEASLVNVLEPGDKIIIGVNGYFGTRLSEMASRMGAEVVTVDVPWGQVLRADALAEALETHPDARVLAVVHAETSTGARQPLEEIGAYLRGKETLFLVDAVTSIGGIPVEVDEVGIDICYAGTQKCLGVPPGLAPITFSAAAMDRVRSRKTPVASWYLDTTLIGTYLGAERRYHHTVPINMFYGLHESLRMIEEEGLEARFDRHAEVGRRLQDELERRGFASFTDADHRLPELTAVRLPGGREEAPLRARLLDEYEIEVGGGLGPAKGTVWRIGLMGYGATHDSVDRLLDAVDEMGIHA